MSMTSKTPPANSVVTPELVKRHGLTEEEFERIKKILGREPNFTELGIFSVMWSEHCSYKNSKKELKKFPTAASLPASSPASRTTEIASVSQQSAAKFISMKASREIP